MLGRVINLLAINALKAEITNSMGTQANLKVLNKSYYSYDSSCLIGSVSKIALFLDF